MPRDPRGETKDVGYEVLDMIPHNTCRLPIPVSRIHIYIHIHIWTYIHIYPKGSCYIG